MISRARILTLFGVFAGVFIIGYGCSNNSSTGPYTEAPAESRSDLTTPADDNPSEPRDTQNPGHENFQHYQDNDGVFETGSESDTPADTTEPSTETTQPPEEELEPLTDIVLIDFTAFNYDSLGSRFPLFIRSVFETKQLTECENSRLASNWAASDTGIVYDFLGIPPYNCYGGPPAAADLGTQFGFLSETATIVIRYDGQTDVYRVSEADGGGTIVDVVQQSFTQLK